MSGTRSKTPVGKKNPVVAAVASFFIPGLGQIYSGEVRKGMGFIIIAIIFASVWLFLIRERQPDMAGPVLAASGACVLFWTGNMYDAYKTANEIKKMNNSERPPGMFQ